MKGLSLTAQRMLNYTPVRETDYGSGIEKIVGRVTDAEKADIDGVVSNI